MNHDLNGNLLQSIVKKNKNVNPAVNIKDEKFNHFDDRFSEEPDINNILEEWDTNLKINNIFTIY